jgi:PPOX class probable F420-dependent enzyme
MGLELDDLGPEVLDFLTERHLATLTTLHRDGRPHVVPVGFTYDPQAKIARVITSGDSVKAGNAARAGAVGALCQVDRARWLTLSGPMQVDTDPGAVADAVRRYAERYRQPRDNPKRVVLIMSVTGLLASSRLG